MTTLTELELPWEYLIPSVIDLAILASEDHRVLSLADPGSGIWVLAHLRMTALSMPGHEGPLHKHETGVEG